jgi:hypothetical protein
LRSLLSCCLAVHALSELDIQARLNFPLGPTRMVSFITTS